MSFSKEMALKVVFGDNEFYNNNTIFHLIAELNCPEILDRFWNNTTDEQEFKQHLQLKNTNGETCLHVAAKQQRGCCAERIIAQMFDMGADLNAQEDGTGNTILHIAVKNKDYELVEYLLEQSSSRNIENNDRLTPYQLAEQDNDPEIMDIFSEPLED
ncbi:ank1 [Bracoviriform indiense]|uniref:Ank1 n=1 Tax=Bracoviriform indiense TaxID=116759 RepID=Q2THU8_9VIRU|nr:ank1 [Bracoviriform indiense]AAZ30030.1 ank1 [Bracoviriform indiense]